tara:strand:- start:728 stop:1591 length:864 start_codon:yes stop_codon:yes gene_type:complete
MNNFSSNRGFTLIEVLVSMAIGAIILAALFLSFIMFSRTYDLQREMTRNQENGRLLLDYMANEIRNAGYSHFNSGSPVPVNQAIILEAPITNSASGGTLPTDCGESISIMFDIVPSESDMGSRNFIRKQITYKAESYQPGGQAALARCRLKRYQCHYGYNSGSSSFSALNTANYPCDLSTGEVVLDYVYDLSVSLSDYKYDHIAGRMTALTRASSASFNYATSGCTANFKTNVLCGQYSTRIRNIDLRLALVSGEEISTIPDDPNDTPDKGQRFLTNFNASMTLRNP